MMTPTPIKEPITIPAIAPPPRDELPPLLEGAEDMIGVTVGPGFETMIVVGWPETVTTEIIGDALVVGVVDTYPVSVSDQLRINDDTCLSMNEISY